MAKNLKELESLDSFLNGFSNVVKKAYTSKFLSASPNIRSAVPGYEELNDPPDSLKINEILSHHGEGSYFPYQLNERIKLKIFGNFRVDFSVDNGWLGVIDTKSARWFRETAGYVKKTANSFKRRFHDKPENADDLFKYENTGFWIKNKDEQFEDDLIQRISRIFLDSCIENILKESPGKGTEKILKKWLNVYDPCSLSNRTNHDTEIEVELSPTLNAVFLGFDYFGIENDEGNIHPTYHGNHMRTLWAAEKLKYKVNHHPFSECGILEKIERKFAEKMKQKDVIRNLVHELVKRRGADSFLEKNDFNSEADDYKDVYVAEYAHFDYPWENYYPGIVITDVPDTKIIGPAKKPKSVQELMYFEKGDKEFYILNDDLVIKEEYNFKIVDKVNENNPYRFKVVVEQDD